MNRIIEESLNGIVSRVTFHNPSTGWSVIRVQTLSNASQQETVIVYQTRVFAGATMSFKGTWIEDQKYGRQFKASQAIEKKPATTAAIEKYLGSGLIKGVGPKTAKKIVKHFGSETLSVFENQINKLTQVPGIAAGKLSMIETAWVEHRSVRDVMMFLQGHGISTLFAVRIYKKYGEKAIEAVKSDPYRLSNDIYGIGFFSADKVALSLDFALDSTQRIRAAIKHILAASREQGHCYLTHQQIHQGVKDLIGLDLQDRLSVDLNSMQEDDQLRTRNLEINQTTQKCFYSKTLYYDETSVAENLKRLRHTLDIDQNKVSRWLEKYNSSELELSEQQLHAVTGVVSQGLSVLTGGPGCGKTTTTLMIVHLLQAMGRTVLLSAPTGRATQRMAEVIGQEAKTIHRLLVWQNGVFKHNAENPLDADFLIVDECSMLDVSLTASLLTAVPHGCQVLLIGDADQLPPVGAGNVLKDIISSGVIPCFRLTTVFRQAKQSHIIQYAHQINHGNTPFIDSPFKTPAVWKNGADCMFIDSDEATQKQIGFVLRVKRFFNWKLSEQEQLTEQSPYEFRTGESITSAYEQEFTVPDQFAHVDLESLSQSEREVDALKAVLRDIHPWSSLNYGLSCVDTVVKLYMEWIPKYQGQDTEIQILTPMTRGSLGTVNLNKVIQENANPANPQKHQLSLGERIFREGDRVIHRRNNYDLNVFNGDIGKIVSIDNEEVTCSISFYPDGRVVDYKKDDIMELDLAYAITIHKSQGSEFKTVIIPVLTQHFKMLYRNLIYTGLTRARSLAVLVGTRRAFAMAIKQQDTSVRQTALKQLID